MNRVLCFQILFLTFVIGCRTPEGGGSVSNSIREKELADAERALGLNAEALRKIDQNEFEQAEMLFKQALELDSDYGTVHNNLGSLYFRQSKLYLAAWEFQYANKLMPHKPQPANNMGLVYEEANQLDKAIQWYTIAYEMDPNTTEIMGNLARARLRRGDSDTDLREMLERLAIEDPRTEWSMWAKEQAALMQITE